MKKRKKILTVLIIFGMVFAVVSYSPKPNDFPMGEEENKTEEQKKEILKLSESHNPFVIDDTGGGDYTWAQAKAAGLCTGSGTQSDPYIIEDLVIDGEKSASCIEIRSSNKNFIIQNCVLFNSADDPAYFRYGGVKVSWTKNGIIRDNEMYNNEMGIYLYDCDEIKIYNNIIEQNNDSGIKLGLSHNNLITDNELISNYLSGIHLINSRNNDISGNRVSEHIFGIIISAEKSKENNIHDNELFNNTQVGVQIGSTTGTNYIRSNKIIDNWSGIRIEHVSNGIAVVEDNFIYNNREAIGLYKSSRTIVRRNNFSYNNIFGMFISASTNNTITKNYIYKCGMGFRSIESNDNRYNNNIIKYNTRGLHFEKSNQNNVTRNEISNNNVYGVKLEVNSLNNNLYENYFINNGAHAIDNGANNTWDNGEVGNYWDDYIGLDENYDNIGDIPYYIAGMAESKDNCPLFTPPVDFAVFQNDIQFEAGIGETDVYATIRNYLISYKEDIVVEFFEEKPSGNISSIGTKIIHGLDRNEEKTLSIRWTPKLFHFIIVSIDPDNLIFETNRENNVAKKGGGGNSPTTGEISSDFGVWSDANTVGYFFALIPLLNTFYVEIIDLDDDVINVTFKIGIQENDGIPHGDNVWRFACNMGNLTIGNNKLEITARDNLDLVSETRTIIIKIIEIPSWISLLIIGPLPIKFEDSKLTISFEIDAIGLAKTLGIDMPNLGDSDMKPEIIIKFTFWYDFSTNRAELSIGGEFKFEVKFAGREIKITIGITGTGGFRLEDWALILDQVKIEIKFKLSLTLWGYGAEFLDYFEIGIGIDLEFTFILNLIFDVIDGVFDWAETKMRLILGIVGWVKFKLNLGFMEIEARGEAGGGIALDFIWTKEGFSWGFNGYLKVGYKLKFKFLFFSFSAGATYEWWLFEQSPLEVNKTIIEQPLNYTKDYSTPIDSRPRVATDNEGNAMMVWTYNRNETGKMYTDLCYSTWNGTDWAEARYITFDNNSDFDPTLTYDSNGNVIVIWSRFKDDVDSLTAQNPIELLEAQEIAYSIWDGSSWTEPQLLTNDTHANGRAVISAGQNGELIAVWVGDPDHNFSTTKDMELFYSVWNGTHWSAKKQLTNDEYMDYSASLAHDSMGNAMICWIRDLDGNRSSTTDIQLLYSLWDGNSWSEPSKVIESAESKESPSITFDLNDNLLITWVGRNETMSKLYFTSWNKTTKEWNTPEIVHEEGFFIFNPAINVDPNNTAVIVWRGFEDDEAERVYYHTHNATETYFDGELCYATKDLTRSDAVWSELKYLTSNNKTDWMASAVIIRGYSNDLLLVWDMDGAVSNLVHEIKPDLFISDSDISFSDEKPMEGVKVDITATISNIGDVRAKDVLVAFYNGDPNNEGILIGTKLIPFLDYDTKINVTMPWAAQPGNNKIYVVVDYEEEISEINETNNIAMKSIDILPDLTLTSTDISFSNPNPIEGEDIFIKATIYNFGGTKAENFRVTFYDNENVIRTVEIDILHSYDFEEISVIWKAKPGLHNITVVIDPIDEILEWNETNNNASAIIYVYPDIKIIDFSISNNILIYGENVELSGEVQNIGATTASDISLELYDGNPFIDGILLGTKTILSLNIGQKASFLFNWVEPTPGIHKIFAIIDRQNIIDESDETNNLLYQELMVLNLPDLTISEPEFVYTLDYIEINTPIENIGAGGATGVVIYLYDGNPLTNGELIVSKLITYIGAGQSEIASLKLPRIPKSDYLYIIIDPNNIIEESSEVNNQLIITYSDIIKVDAGSDKQVEEGELVEFSAILYGGISGEFNFQWDFGDGSTGVGKSATHQYGDNGIYNVVLTVTGSNFLGTDELIVAVSNVAPIVDAGLDQTVNEDDTVIFTGSFSDPGIMDTHTIEWDFGDGTIFSGILNPSHVYTDKGTYIVSLTVIDDDGGVSMDEMIVIVHNVVPIADAGDDLISYDDEITSFDASNSWDTVSDLPTLQYSWDFGDGSFGDGPIISHKYLDVGTYFVTLTVVDDDNAISTDSCIVAVKDDDENPPVLLDLSIIDDIHTVNISLRAYDESGIDYFKIYIDGILIEPQSETHDGDSYTFILKNEWILQHGIHEVDIFVTDADNDRASDNLTSSILGTFTNSLNQMYDYVDWQIEILKVYIEENTYYRVNRYLNKKLGKVQNYLMEAFNSIETGDITTGLFKDSLAKVYLQICELLTEIYHKITWIDEEITEFIIVRLHEIRNNIVIIMGASISMEIGNHIALIEVDLLDLADYIEENVDCKGSRSLEAKIESAAILLEGSLFLISINETPNSLLEYAQYTLDGGINKVNQLLIKGRISQELAEYLNNTISQLIEDIQVVKENCALNENITSENLTVSNQILIDNSEDYTIKSIDFIKTREKSVYGVILMLLAFLGICLNNIKQNLILALRKGIK